MVIQKKNIRRLEKVDKDVRARNFKIPKGTAEILIREERDVEH